MSQTKQILQIAVSRPIYFALDYLYVGDAAEIGCRVRVPLGNTEVTGVIINKRKADGEQAKLKPISRLLDTNAIFDEQLIRLFIWASQYYHAPIGEIIFTALPIALRKTRQLPIKKAWQLSPQAESLDISSLNQAKKQKQLLGLFSNKEPIWEEDCKKISKTGYRNLLKALQQKGWIEAIKLSPFAQTQKNKATDFKQSLELSDEQQQCLHDFHTWINEKPLKPILLHGITGGGKTEVYLRMISESILAGKQALVLVPEIGLTTQLIDRFQAYFPNQYITTLNSSVAKGERLENWIAVKSGDADIVIGTRSAVFASFKALGIIIIDEEHDASFKQQDGFRYHARDIAVKRAYDLQIPIVLGSATPSLESLHNSQQGKYYYSTLKRRPGSRTPPDIIVQDTKGLPLETGLSQP